LLKAHTAAQKQEKQATNSNAWILTSTLPEKYRAASIIPPPKIPTTEHESAYVGLYTFIIATIYLAGGTLPEAKLERYLRRTNADQSTPIDKTDKLLQRLIKEGYIVRIKDSSTGEEVVEYKVGPRGKVEIGDEGVMNFVRTVYGSGTEDLEKRLERSLGFTNRRLPPVATTNGAAVVEGSGTRGRARQQEQEEQAEEGSSGTE